MTFQDTLVKIHKDAPYSLAMTETDEMEKKQGKTKINKGKY